MKLEAIIAATSSTVAPLLSHAVTGSFDIGIAAACVIGSAVSAGIRLKLRNIEGPGGVVMAFVLGSISAWWLWPLLNLPLGGSPETSGSAAFLAGLTSAMTVEWFIDYMVREKPLKKIIEKIIGKIGPPV